jgi:hypothetical protein
LIQKVKLNEILVLSGFDVSERVDFFWLHLFVEKKKLLDQILLISVINLNLVILLDEIKVLSRKLAHIKI